MRTKPYMKIYWGDYLRDTQHLRPIEHGVYFLLIAHYWSHGGLPDDDAVLARIGKVTRSTWMKMRPVISDFFEPGWVHKRIDAELSGVDERSEAQSKKAKKRWSDENFSHRRVSKVSHPQNETFKTTTDEIPAKTTDDPCHGIDPAMPETCLSDFRLQTPVGRDEKKRTRADYAQIEHDLRQAAGWETRPEIALLDVSSIVALLDGGASLVEDVLPIVRSKASRCRFPSWKFFVVDIQQSRSDRAALRDGPLPAPNRPASGRPATTEIKNPFVKAALNRRLEREQESSDDEPKDGRSVPDSAADGAGVILDAERGHDGGWGVDYSRKSRP